jgi:hypothetical protein
MREDKSLIGHISIEGYIPLAGSYVHLEVPLL